ncbi:hypothetical protein LOTGIDRAFT_233600 [Lottia gigantea]|uniref:RNA helicase n=1 Tax=Lottia gigantea TaxID=225164 RepID=V4A730_LOTGI|nr:hypothetical protein LOTGIDRAFT_233600 [Lottia gigantea]ESO90820.1 hypothetical protein LOTGIDRAFT_233600 [Lottia gigantea]
MSSSNLLDITIIKVNNPGDFLGKECPSVQKANGRFYQVMDEMNEYCNNDQMFFNENFQPKIGQEVYAGLRLKDRKWHRVKVENVLQTSRGRQCNVDLIDYGEEAQIPVSNIRRIPAEFQPIEVPVQVTRYSLYGIQALTLGLDLELQAKKIPCVVWDEAATAYMKKLNKDSTKPQVDIKYTNKEGVRFVQLYLRTQAGKICVNDDLVKKEYATLTQDQINKLDNFKNGVYPVRIQGKKPVDIDEMEYEIDQIYQTIDNTRKTEEKKHSPHKSPQAKTILNSEEDLQFFKKFLAEHRGEKQSNKYSKTMTDVSSGDDTSLTSPPAKSKTTVSDSEALKQRLQIKPPDPKALPSNMTRLSELAKLLRSQKLSDTSKSADLKEHPTVVSEMENNKNVLLLHSADIDTIKVKKDIIPPTFKKARLPKFVQNNTGNSATLSVKSSNVSGCMDSDTESAISLSSSTSVPKSPRHEISPNTSLSSSKGEQRSILKKSQVKRLSDTSDSPTIRFSELSSDEASIICSTQIEFDDEEYDPDEVKRKFVGQAHGRRLLEKLVPTKFYQKTYCTPGMEKLKSLPELIHGVGNIQPYTDLENLPFSTQINQYIEDKKFATMFTVQAYSWPAILKGRSVVGVSPSHTGKTLAYLLPILTQLFQASLYLTLPSGGGPIVLILVSSWKKAKYVYEECREVISGRKDNKLLVLYAGGSEDSQITCNNYSIYEFFSLQYALLEGCKILVATPNCLLRMLDRGYTNLSRLCHLVIDDGEILTEQFTEQMNSFMKQYALALREIQDLNVPRQIVLFSSQWTPYVEAFTKTYFQAPLIMILSRTEGAVYGKVKQVVHMCASRQRSSVLSHLLENIDKKGHKIMIFASEIEDVESIRQLLMSRSMYGIIAHNNMTLAQLNEASRTWRDSKPSSNSVIMVCTDECIANLSITDATHVIHYDQPPSKTKFGVRLSCLFNYYRNLPEKIKPSITPVSDILATENSLQSARTLSSFLQRSGAVIPPEFKHLVAGLQAGRDDDENIALCPYVKAFGKCSNHLRCTYRHQIIPETDNSDDKNNPNLPICGETKMKILSIIDASHYYARLLEVRLPHTTDILDLTADYLQLFTQMDTHYKSHSHKIHRMSKVGDICAINDSNNQYHRVKILKIYYSKAESTSEKAVVQYIDYGTQKDVLCSQLLFLPPLLKVYPPQAVEVYLCRVKPIDNDSEWTPKANSCLFDLINNIIIDGRIVLSLGNTIWVDPLAQREYLENIRSTINKMNIRSELIKNKLATDNPEHVRDLIELFSGKIPIDDTVIKSYLCIEQQEEENESEILPEALEYHDVYVTAVDHPGRFHVQKINLNQELEDIQDKIKEKILSDEITSLVELPSVGDYCLAPYHDDQEHRWYRSKVVEIEDEKRVKVFYVDYGDPDSVEFTELKYLPRKYRTLPHQAIECQLADIKPSGKEWIEESGNLLWDLSRYITKEYKPMVAQVCCKHEVTGRYVYDIKLYDTTSNYDIDISKEILWRLPHQHVCDNDQIQNLFPKLTSYPDSFTKVTDIPTLCSCIYWNEQCEGLIEQLECIVMTSLLQPRPCFTTTTNLFPKLTSYPDSFTKVTDIPTLCSCIYWNEQCEGLIEQLECIVMTSLLQPSQVSIMCLNGSIKSMVMLIGYIFNVKAHGHLLSIITQATLTSDKFATACNQATIQHSLSTCLEQVSCPVIQEQAAECMARLALQQESLREGWENSSCITIVCDLLEMTESDQIQCYMCQILSALLQDNQRTCDIIEKENAVNIASQLLLESTHHNTQEAAIQFLSSLSLWDSAQKKIKKHSVISAVMEFMMNALCNMCLHYGVMLCQYLSQASRKNKTLLLEKNIFQVLRRLMTLDIDSKTKILCDELQSSLAVRTPQQDLTNIVTINNHHIPTEEQDSAGPVMPPVSWSQSSYKVRVTVNAPGSRQEDYIINPHSIQFKARLENREYGLDLDLFDEIKPETSRIDIIGNRAQLILNKYTKGTWSRLLKQKHKTSAISRDFDKIINSSDSENSDDNIPALIKGKKAKLPTTGPEVKYRSPYMEDNDSSHTSDSLVLDSEDEKMEDEFNYFEYKS